MIWIMAAFITLLKAVLIVFVIMGIIASITSNLDNPYEDDDNDEP